MSDFIHRLPKAELHLHLEGCVEPATLAEVSRRHTTAIPFPGNKYEQLGERLPVLSEDDVRELYRYKDFHGFLMAFKAVTEQLKTADDYELITFRMMQRLHAHNVLHAEVYVSVGVVHWRGQEFAEVFRGIESGRTRGERDFGVSVLWIFDAVRQFGPEAAQRVLEETVRCREHSEGVVGFGIGGDERRAPPEMFREVYAQARERGLRLTVHAGEAAGPESVWGAINLGAERIGHGLSAGQDPELVATLVERQIPLELCLSSNLRTGCCAALNRHPVKTYFDAGVMVTLNSDDPAMFETSLEREYELAQKEFGFTDEQLREIARNSFEASFLPAEKKLRFLDMVDRFPI
jgi:adenosine deaminase/aminodeoxyfutalosine deaminase